MQTNNFYGQVWEYLLVISPPEEVKHSIGKIKKEVGVKYGSSHAMHSIAYISLVKFLLIKGYERNMLTSLFGFFVNKMPIEIMLNNFDVFPRHTLYTGVQESGGLNNLQNGLTSLLTRSLSVREKNVRASKKHHMTIAGNLDPVQFHSIAGEYRNRQFNASFRAKNIVLLKRLYDEYNTGSYKWRGSHIFVMGCS